MPRSYGGYTDPQEMQQMAGGNPWYNPLMSTPDWGAGIRSTLNSMWAFKEKRRQEEEAQREAAEKEAENLRRWEAQQAQEERRLQVLENPKDTPTVMEQRQSFATARVLNGTWTQEQADEYSATGAYKKTFDLPKESKAAIVAAYPKLFPTEQAFDASPESLKVGIIQHYMDKLNKPVEPTVDQATKDRKFLDESIVALGKAKTRVFAYKDMNRLQKQAALEGLSKGVAKIGGYRKLIASGQPLPQGIRDTVSALVGDPTGLMTGDLSAILGDGGAAPQQAAPAQAPPQGPPQQGGDVQVIAREIINRAARNGKQLSPQEAEALAIQYLQSKQNAPR